MTSIAIRGLPRTTRWIAAGLSALALLGCGASGSDGPSETAQARPDRLSRAEFVAKVSDHFSWYHASGYNDVWKVPLRTFVDVQASDPYGKQIENAYEENVIAPDANGKFKPQQDMTREDAAVILVKAFFLQTPPRSMVSTTPVPSPPQPGRASPRSWPRGS
jgi:S-layer homology domain